MPFDSLPFDSEFEPVNSFLSPQLRQLAALGAALRSVEDDPDFRPSRGSVLQLAAEIGIHMQMTMVCGTYVYSLDDFAAAVGLDRDTAYDIAYMTSSARGAAHRIDIVLAGG